MTTKWSRDVRAIKLSDKFMLVSEGAEIAEVFDKANAELFASASALYEALAALLITDRTEHTFNCACDDCLHYNKSREDALAALRAAQSGG